MEEFAPILLLLFFWLVIGLPVSLAKKAANQKKPNRPSAPKNPAGEESPAAREPVAPERLTTLTPSLYEPHHDDSVFTGSLGAFSGEGYDPCHEEQMSSMELVCKPEKPEPAPKADAGLSLGWTGNEIVRGIVMSEILNRKKRA